MEEFLTRFLLHVLPSCFWKLRFQGLLAHPVKKTNLAAARTRLGETTLPVIKEEDRYRPSCPNCDSDRVQLTGILRPQKTGVLKMT